MNASMMGYLWYFAVMMVGVIIYANIVGRIKVEGFLRVICPLYAVPFFEKKKNRLILYVACFLSLLIPAIAAVPLTKCEVAQAFMFCLFQWLLSWAASHIAISAKIKKRYVRPYVKDNPELGEYYKPVFSYLRETPSIVSKVCSRDIEVFDEIVACYEETYGDYRYSEDNEKTIDISDWLSPEKKKPSSSDKKAVGKEHINTRTKSEGKNEHRFCTECGAKLTTKDARFCSSCGHKVS